MFRARLSWSALPASSLSRGTGLVVARAPRAVAPPCLGAVRLAGTDQSRHDIGAGPGAANLSLAEWSRKKNAGGGPAVSAGFVGEWCPEDRLCIVAERVTCVPDYFPAVVLHGVLTKEECQGLIAAVPQGGPGFLGKDEVYDLYNDRVVKYRYMTHDEALAQRLFKRIRQYLPTELDGGKLLRCNPGFRFVHHDQGGHQAGHIDGREPVEPEFVEPAGGWVQSRLTLQIYLNDGYQGGEFVVLEPHADSPGGYRPKLTHVPRAGDAVVFYQERLVPPSEQPHEFFHEARDVIAGDKFACRSMIDYVFHDVERARLSNLKDDME